MNLVINLLKSFTVPTLQHGQVDRPALQILAVRNGLGRQHCPADGCERPANTQRAGCQHSNHTQKREELQVIFLE